MKLFLDLAPLIAFFIGYKMGGIQLATGLIIVVTLVALGIGYQRERKISWTPLITGVVVTFFGVLTLVLHDETFIKMKPTIVNLIFAAILVVGLLKYKTGLLKHLFGSALHLNDDGWKVLSRRWAWFFLFLAGLNELVWRNVSTENWVDFKVFGLIGLFFMFNVVQLMLMGKYLVEPPEEAEKKQE